MNLTQHVSQLVFAITEQVRVGEIPDAVKQTVEDLFE